MGQTRGPVVCPGSQRTKVLEVGSRGCGEEPEPHERVSNLPMYGALKPITSSHHLAFCVVLSLDQTDERFILGIY